jgi:PhnB protein
MNYKPKNYHTVTAYLTCRDAAAALEFYKRAFGAEETLRLVEPSGKIGHCEFRIGDSMLMMADEYPEMNITGPETRGGTTVGIHLYVPDAREFFECAVAAGATPAKPVTEQFYGDLAGQLVDPFGHKWFVATATRDVTKEEMIEKWDEMMKGSS